MSDDPFSLLLAARLHRPRVRAKLVRRPRLTARLTDGASGPLTLVSAPAGFGKSALLAEWLSETSTPAAWLSLSPEDNEPACLLRYLVAALQTNAPSVGQGLSSVPQSREIEVLLTRLLNDLTTLPGPFVL